MVEIVDARVEIENLIKEKLGLLSDNSDRIITKTKQGDVLYDLSEGSVGKLVGVSKKMSLVRIFRFLTLNFALVSLIYILFREMTKLLKSRKRRSWLILV